MKYTTNNISASEK